MKRLGYLIVGCGRISGPHRAALESIEGARIVAVADADESKARALADACADAPTVYLDGAEALADPQVDVVVVTVPTHLHCELVVAAAGAGKHVYCEKAVATSVSECRRMIAARDAAGIRVSIGQSTRFQPACMMARSLVESGFQRPHRLFREALETGGDVPLSIECAQVNLEWGMGAYLSSARRCWIDLPLAGEFQDFRGPVRETSLPVVRV